MLKIIQMVGLVTALLTGVNAYADQFTDWCNQLSQQYGHPVCYVPPPCISQIEFQSLSCGPNQIGNINQSRQYFCSTQSWGPWTTTSNNCSPAPPSCQTSTSQQVLACPIHYTGQITQQATTSCPNPYGQPVPGQWTTITNSCVQDPPTCHASQTTRTLSCQTHFSGTIIQTDTVTCSDPYGQPSDSGWVTTTNSCSPDPATCNPSVQTQTLSCQPGYTGSIIQNRSSSCSDPYSTPTWSDWATTSNTCIMTATNINNPVSPISPISPTNPNSVISKSTTQTAVQPVDVPQNPVIVSTPSSSTTTSPSTSSSNTSSSSNTTTTVQTTVPKGKEIVPGFGIVMSMQMLNAGYNMQQQQLTEYITLIQEQEYGKQQDFLIDFITSNDTGDNLDRIADYRWRSLLGNNPLQRNGFND